MGKYDAPRISMDERATVLDRLKKEIENLVLAREYVFVGVGAEALFETTKERLMAACRSLEDSGDYKIHYVRIGNLLQEGETIHPTAKIITFSTKMPYENVWRHRHVIVRNMRKDFAELNASKNEVEK